MVHLSDATNQDMELGTMPKAELRNPNVSIENGEENAAQLPIEPGKLPGAGKNKRMHFLFAKY